RDAGLTVLHHAREAVDRDVGQLVRIEGAVVDADVVARARIPFERDRGAVGRAARVVVVERAVADRDPLDPAGGDAGVLARVAVVVDDAVLDVVVARVGAAVAELLAVLVAADALVVGVRLAAAHVHAVAAVELHALVVQVTVVGAAVDDRVL